MDYKEERAQHAASGVVYPLTIHTRVPSKWRFVDLETGDVWKWQPSAARGSFARAGKLVDGRLIVEGES